MKVACGAIVLRCMPCALGLALLLAQPLRAQEASAAAAAPWVVGGSVGVPGHEGELAPELFTLAGYAVHAVPYRIGVDIVVGTMPRVLTEGVVPVGSRAGLVLPVPLQGATLVLPTAGVGFVSAFGGSGFGAQSGVHAGVSVLMLEDERGVRFGVTWHRLRGLRGTIWLAEFGFATR